MASYRNMVIHSKISKRNRNLIIIERNRTSSVRVLLRLRTALKVIEIVVINELAFSSGV